MQWFKQFISTNRQTKYFILNWALYAVILVLTTAYCYARLDYVRSYKKVAPPYEYETRIP